MTVWLYYRKSIDKMVLLNDDPSKFWKDDTRDHTCEIYIKDKITFNNLIGSLVREGEGQEMVAYALRIDPGDCSEDSDGILSNY